MNHISMKENGIARLPVYRVPVDLRLIDGNAVPSGRARMPGGMVDETLTMRTRPDRHTAQANGTIAQRHPRRIGLHRAANVEVILMRRRGGGKIIGKRHTSDAAWMHEYFLAQKFPRHIH